MGIIATILAFFVIILICLSNSDKKTEAPENEYIHNPITGKTYLKNSPKQPSNTPIIIARGNNIKCPNCGSTRVQSISTINRAISISVLGLASSKIGKQYQCNACKYKW